MAFFIKWLFFILVIAQTAFCQNLITDLERAWQEDRFDEMERLLPAAEQSYPNHPTILFFRALISDDAEKAYEYYKKVLEIKADNRYADTALFKMAQYQYARERYAAARRSYVLLQRQFTKSKWADDSYYLAGQCYLAEGKVDSARLTWKKLIQAHPRSPYADLAVGDLEIAQAKPPLGAESSSPVKSPVKSVRYYAIQVGAFSQTANARSILAGLEKVGYEGQIVEKKVGSRTFFAVWIGRFPDQSAAEDYARRLITKVTKEYQIVKSE